MPPNIGGFITLLVLVVIYFLPSFVAIANTKRNAPAIITLNFLLGWTVLGWVGALIWAIVKDAPTPTPTV